VSLFLPRPFHCGLQTNELIHFPKPRDKQLIIIATKSQFAAKALCTHTHIDAFTDIQSAGKTKPEKCGGGRAKLVIHSCCFAYVILILII